MDAEARGEGETLERHKRALLELAMRQKLTITQIYSEIVSGETIAARPVMQQLLSEVEQGMWEGVLVMEVERLARGETIDQGIVAQTFKLSGTKIITPMKTYDPNNEYDEEYFEFGLFMSRREYKTINRRLQRGRVASVKEGKYVGNKPPYGYVRKKLEHDKGFTLEPEPEQAPIVKFIFDLYTQGEQQPDGTYEEMGIAKIIRKLNTLKIPSCNGDVWVNSTLQNMLRNPVYIGKIRWNARPSKKRMVDGQMVKERPRAKQSDWILADGLHEALIDNKTWELTQQKLATNTSRPTPTHFQTKNPLAGLIVCGVCGRKMIRRPYPNGYPDSLMCAVTACNNISSQLEYVEERLLVSLRAWLDNYKIAYGKQPAAASQISIIKKALNDAQSELIDTQKQRDNIYDLLEKGIYTTEVFLERSQNVNNKLAELQNNIANINAEIEREALTEQSRKTIIPQAEYVLKQYKKAKTPAEKNALLKTVIEKAVYIKTVNGRWHNKPDEFELTIFPKIPRIVNH